MASNAQRRGLDDLARVGGRRRSRVVIARERKKEEKRRGKKREETLDSRSRATRSVDPATRVET